MAYRFADIYTAPALASAAAVAQCIWLRATGKRIEATHWINLSVIVIFGGATLWLHSDVFIKWKPTVLYWLFGGALLGARVLFKRNLMRSRLGTRTELLDAALDKLNLSWPLFFLAAGGCTLSVAFSGLLPDRKRVTF